MVLAGRTAMAGVLRAARFLYLQRCAFGGKVSGPLNRVSTPFQTLPESPSFENRVAANSADNSCQLWWRATAARLLHSFLTQKSLYRVPMPAHYG